MSDVRIVLDASPAVIDLGTRLLRELRDIRLLLGRIGWNALARAEREQDTEPGVPPTGATPAEVGGVVAPGARDSGTAPAEAPVAGVPQAAGEASGPRATPVAAEPARAPAPADIPARLGRNGQPFKWSAERDALLTELYRAGEPLAAILPRINALPGVPVMSLGGLKDRIQILALATRHRPRPPAPPTPATAPAQAEPAGEKRALDVPSLKLAAGAPVPAASFPEGAPDFAGARTWTPERDAQALRMADDGAARVEILATLNALPGPPIASTEALGVRLSGLRKRRAAEAPQGTFRRAPLALVERDGAPSVAKMQMAAEEAALGTVPITLTEALLWGTRNGCAALREERPMAHFARVNQKRSECGVPRFTLIPERSRLDPLPPPHIGGEPTRRPAA